MGVPAFYRWLSQKYPKIVSDVVEDEPMDELGRKLTLDSAAANPNGIEFDNLYLDMNGIIHPCFHPETGPQPTSFEEVYTLILRRLDEIIAVANPRKLVYLAVDGPAPRAKMNQQRGRRFRTALETEQKRSIEEALRERYMSEGRDVPATKSQPMDSNVITPGTEFMAMLGRWLRHWAFVTVNDQTRVFPFRVILSDASVPGEGEHKAMAYIRAQVCCA